MSFTTKFRGLKLKSQKIFTEKPFEFLGILIGLLALSLTIWQAYEQRKFNKLSTKPKIQTRIWNSYGETSTIEIKLKNVGVGVAIVDDIQIETKNRGKVYKVSELHGKFWSQICEDFHFPDSLITKNLTTEYLDVEAYLPANNEIQFCVYSYDLQKPHNQFIDFLKRIENVKVKYHSVYEEKDETTTQFHIDF